MCRILQIFFVLLLLIGIGGKSAISQQPDIKFNRFVVEDGLTSINSIVQDQNGFMWFGGTHGLYRHDGYEFKIFTNNPNDSTSICGNNVISLYPEKEGFLWVGTANAGMCLYNPRKDNFTHFKNIGKHPVSCIHRDHQGLLWAGTIGNGVYVLDKNNRVIEHFQNHSNNIAALSNNDVFDIYEDNIGRIWIATNSGALDLFQREKKLFERFWFNQGGYQSVRSGQKIFRDHQGYFWIGTEGDGLYRFDEKDKSFKHYYQSGIKSNTISNNIITGMVEGAPGEIWITTDGGGLNLLNTKTLDFHHFKHNPLDPNSLTNNSSYSIFIDKRLTLWLGMGDGVVNVSQNSPFKVYLPSSSGENRLSFRVVVTLCLAQNNKLWIGTGGSGIDVLDLNTRTFKNYRNSPDNPNSISTNIILTLNEDSKHNIWSGTFLGGADRINTKTGRITNFKNNIANPNSLINDHIFDIEEDEHGNIWFATMGGGLDFYNPTKNEFIHFQHNQEDSGGINSDRVRCLFEDSKNRLWLGTDEGAQFLNLKNQIFINQIGRINLPELLKNTPVHDITEDSDGNIWLATDALGLCKLNPEDEEWTTFQTDNGMPSNSVYGVFEDNNGYIWSCTNKGISRYNQRNGKFYILNTDDGLPTNDFEAGSIVQTNDGELFFSSKKGLISFYPNEIEQNIEEVEVTLTGFRLFNKLIEAGQNVDGIVPLENTISHTQKISLPHYLNNISFEFAAPGFQNPAKIKYKYQLSGADNRWIETDSKMRLASYSNLTPGDYTFKIIGANSAGVWGSKETIIKVSISPPFWKTGWAYLLYLVVLGTIIYFVLREYSNRIRLRNQLEIEKYKHEKDNELNLLKIGFFTNISHELRTPLTLILGPLDRLISSFTKDEGAKKQLKVMQRNGERLLHMVNQLLDFRKLESGKMKLQVEEADIVAFIKEISLSFNELAVQKNISFRVKSDYKSLTCFFDKNKVEIMVFNLLSNAFKFTPDQGEVLLRLKPIEIEDVPRVQISVVDSGKGISTDDIENIFELFYQNNGSLDIKGTGIGLALTKNMVELHHGNIEVKSTEGKGSIFTITLPSQKKSYREEEWLTESKEIYQDVEIEQDLLVDVRPLNENLPLMLIVEDNVELNNFIGEGFTSEYEILKAYNGRKGLELALEHIPDIVISDVIMPEMDGVEMCRELKKDFRTSHIPVILLTARSAKIYQIEGLETGADDYITKPFSFELLNIRVANLIEIRRQLHERFKRQSILEPGELSITNPDEIFLQKLSKIIDENISDTELTVEFIAREIGMSHSTLYRKLIALTGKKINDFIRIYRLQRAAQLLQKSDFTINEISDNTGFSNSKYFSTCFKKEYGVTPSEYKKNGKQKA